MPAKKQTKPSRKPTNKDNNLPESVQWLLDFANLGCRSGNLSLQRVFHRTAAKRPPAEPTTLKKVLFDSCFFEEVMSKLDEKSFFNEKRFKNVEEALYQHKLLKHILFLNKKLNKGERVYEYMDENGNKWSKEQNGELIYIGNEDDYPSPEEIKDFLSKTGIKEGRKKLKYRDVKVIRNTVIHSLVYKSEIGNSHYVLRERIQSFVRKYIKPKQIQLPDINIDGKECLINGLKYSHDNTLTQVACAYILDYWHNHRELPQYLRQCKCCGKFWIEAKTKKKFCCKKCENRFNQASRQAVRESLKKQRKIYNRDVDDIAHNEIVDWLCNEHMYKLKEAEKIFKDEKSESSRNVKSLANFRRTYGKKFGLI